MGGGGSSSKDSWLPFCTGELLCTLSCARAVLTVMLLMPTHRARSQKRSLSGLMMCERGNTMGRGVGKKRTKKSGLRVCVAVQLKRHLAARLSR